MPTQTSGFPPLAFSATHPQQSFRLMELPRELVELIDSQAEAAEEGTPLRLRFKSSLSTNTPKTNGSNSSRKPKETTASTQGFLHLCSDEMIWAVKQVSTSNTVYIATTSTTPDSSSRTAGGTAGDNDFDIDMDTENPADGLDQMEQDSFDPQHGITTIAQVKKILELIEVKPDEQSIEAQIRSMVQYHTSDLEDRDGDVPLFQSTDQTQQQFTFASLLAHVPAPDVAIVSVATRLHLFEHSNPHDSLTSKVVYIATPSLLLKAWEEFMQECSLSGVDIGADSDLDSMATCGSIFAGMNAFHLMQRKGKGSNTASSDSLHVAVMRAILRRFKARTINTGPETSLSLLLDTWNDEPVNIDPATWAGKALTFAIARWILQTSAESSSSSSSVSGQSDQGLAVQTFLEKWARLVPDSWSHDCYIMALMEAGESDGVTIETLTADGNVTTAHTEAEFIRAVWKRDDHAGSATDVISTAGGSAAQGTAAAKPDASSAADSKKRKWHEKFSAMRDAKK